MPADAETVEADETGGAKLRLDRGGVGPAGVDLVEDRRDAAQMARCGQCLDDGFLMPFDVDLDDQRFGTLEQRVDAGAAQDADRKSVVSGTRVSVRVDLGGGVLLKKKICYNLTSCTVNRL